MRDRIILHDIIREVFPPIRPSKAEYTELWDDIDQSQKP